MGKMDSLLGKLLGRGNKEQAPTSHEAIQRLRDVEDMLQKKSDFLEAQIDVKLAEAKKFGTRNKRVALKALKCKKRLEKQLQQIDGTLSTIEIQREALENASTNIEVFSVLRGAAQSLESVHKELDLDRIQDLMDQVADQQQISEEIANAFSFPVSGQSYDADDLLAELEAMEEEDLSLQLKTQLIDDVGSGSLNEGLLPDVPASAPRAAQETKDADLKELALWAS